MIVYDLATFNIDRVVPYANYFNRVIQISGKYNRDISEKEYEKCVKIVLFSKEQIVSTKC